MIDLNRLNGLSGSAREFERLKMLYPLFQFEFDGKHLTVQTSGNSSYHTTIENGRVDHDSMRHLDHDHMQKVMSQSLMELYPDLHISVYASKDGANASVWIDRDGRDAEAIGHVDILDVLLHPTLASWQKEALQAKQEGWFFCSGHTKAEPKAEWGYFHFAGNYCKRYGEENPESRKAAARETYN